MPDIDPVKHPRLELQHHMSDYLRATQMPIHLTGEVRSPQAELQALQEIYRHMAALRLALALAHSLYQCRECQHYEGEAHATECLHGVVMKQRRVERPKPQESPPATESVVIEDFTPRQCALADEGCIYDAVPGTDFCKQHEGKT